MRFTIDPIAAYSTTLSEAVRLAERRRHTEAITRLNDGLWTLKKEIDRLAAKMEIMGAQELWEVGRWAKIQVLEKLRERPPAWFGSQKPCALGENEDGGVPRGLAARPYDPNERDYSKGPARIWGRGRGERS